MRVEPLIPDAAEPRGPLARRRAAECVRAAGRCGRRDPRTARTAPSPLLRRIAAACRRWSSSAPAPTSRCRLRRLPRSARCNRCHDRARNAGMTQSLAPLAARLRAHPPRRASAGSARSRVALTALGTLGFFASRDTRVALFATPLRAEQLAEVEQRLAAWNVPYERSATTCASSRAKRGELLLRLSLAGVPHAHLAGSDETLAHVGALTPQTRARSADPRRAGR